MKSEKNQKSFFVAEYRMGLGWKIHAPDYSYTAPNNLDWDRFILGYKKGAGKNDIDQFGMRTEEEAYALANSLMLCRPNSKFKILRFKL